MKSNIADASIASTNLINAMHSINRETERISENPQAVAYFEECKKLRRRVLRYVRYTFILVAVWVITVAGWWANL